MGIASAEQPSAARLGLWDTTSMIVGIIVGVGIYVTPARVFAAAGGPWQGLGVWVLGGLFSLLGAFCFAELASTYPRSGGEYVYLTRAFGPAMGFLFGWAQLAVIRPAGSIAVVAFGFAAYGARLVGRDPDDPSLSVLLALSPLVVLTLVNLLGVVFGKIAQNGLTILKIVGIAGILLVGFLWAKAPEQQTGAVNGIKMTGLARAMVYVLWTYAGWQEAGYVASEVHDRRRNLPLALILGTGTVTVLYVLINLAYLTGLGYERAAHAETVAADVLAPALGEWAALGMSLLVVISTLGALNGMIFTSSRIFAEFGADHALFAALGRWSRRWGTPVVSLLLQGALSAGFVLLAGLMPSGKNGFDRLVEGTAPVFWLFFLLTGTALLVLRWREPHVLRPFRVPFYPFTPLIFCAGCGAMLLGSIAAAPLETLIGIGLLAVGLPLYLLSNHLGRPPRSGGQPEDAEAIVKVGPHVG
jgi:APA family basic amino acid/polyamine antiporter